VFLEDVGIDQIVWPACGALFRDQVWQGDEALVALG
jgi:hypothetical protein